MDDLLMLDASSEEEACWLAVVEHDQQQAREWVRRAEAIAGGHAQAAGAGRAEFVVLEVSCALQVDQITADNVLAEALQLVALPQVRDAVEEGRLRMAQAKALLDQVRPLDDGLAVTVADDVLARCGDRTPEQVRKLARRAVLRADPAAADRRRAAAVAARRMFLRPRDDGMMSLELHLKAETALRVYGRAQEATRADDGSGRSADQRRVDWVVEQILAERLPVPAAHDDDDAPAPAADRRRRRRRRRPWQRQGQVVVPVAVGLDLSDEPCDLVGYGPISAEHGRELLAEAELRKVCVDSRTGQVVAVDEQVHRPQRETNEQSTAEAVRQLLVDMVLTPSFEPAEPEPGYRPSAHLQRTVQLRDVTCDFPFASTPAGRCDTDHTRPFHLRGQTSLSNLGSRSRRAHRAKQAGWTPRPDADGSLLWQSPSGASYRRPPPREHPPQIPNDAALPPPRPPTRHDVPPPTWLRSADERDPDPPADPPRSALPDDPPF